MLPVVIVLMVAVVTAVLVEVNGISRFAGSCGSV